MTENTRAREDDMLDSVTRIDVFPSMSDLWRAAAEYVQTFGTPCAPREQRTREVLFWAAKLADPRRRLLDLPSRVLNPFFLVGEWLWILRGSDRLEHIAYYLARMRRYSDDGVVLRGAYGPRLFGRHPSQGVNQIASVLEKLRRDADSRQAVVQVYLPQCDWVPSRDVPCLCQIQFFLRNQRLHAIATMRSQDLFRGMPYDIGWLTLLQEYLASELGVALGTYAHVCGSLHIYDTDSPAVETILAAPVDDPASGASPLMAPIPRGGASQLAALLEIEECLRGNRPVPDHPLDGLWRDMAALLHVFRHFKDGDVKRSIGAARELGGALGVLAERYVTGAAAGGTIGMRT
jgi:thymidylate synthase